MNTLQLLFVVHNHQPVGNFDYVLAESHERCYLPFLQTLRRFPNVRVALHYSGILLDWFEAHSPQTVKLVSELVARNQIELLSGAYYEPILPAIPERDALGQINRMNEYLVQRFDAVPSGLWLAERVWEPQLPAVIHKSGLKYTLLDDTHLRSAGVSQEPMTGYRTTEYNGYTTAFYAISRKLRYQIPFLPVEEVMAGLRQAAEAHPGGALVFGDDGEKFGLWPGTHDWCYAQGYLEKLFAAFEENAAWLQTVLPAKHLAAHPPAGPTVYVPPGSYDEMGLWTLDPSSRQSLERMRLKLLNQGAAEPEIEGFVRGGFWRNFLTRYPEANAMHKKMLQVSERVWNFAGADPLALEHLWKGQCNCAYWHGVFGGLYLNHLRSAVYRNLIQAEVISDAYAQRRRDWLSVESSDLNGDGRNEYQIASSLLNLYFMPHRGGQVYELDYKQAAFNFADVLSRHREYYHNLLLAGGGAEADTTRQSTVAALMASLNRAREMGLDKTLRFDRRPRGSFIDYLVPESYAFDCWQAEGFGAHEEAADSPYEPFVIENTETPQLRLSADRSAVCGEQLARLRVEKTFSVAGYRKVVASYQVRPLEGEAVRTALAVELNLTLLAGNDPQRYIELPQKGVREPLVRSAEDRVVSHVRLCDEWQKIALEIKTSQPVTLWRAPVETVSLSESGIERNYQGTTLVFLVPVEPAPDGVFRLMFSIEVQQFSPPSGA